MSNRDQECVGEINANPSIGGIGVLIGFTVKAFLTVTFTILREFCTRRFEKHRTSSSPFPNNHTASYYKRQGRNLNKILLSLSDIQSITSISILVASFAQWSTISLYHLALTNYTAQFAQTANLIALSYVRGTMPDRDMLVRDFLTLNYYSMLIVHNILWYQRITGEWDGLMDDKCYIDKTWWVRGGSRPAAFVLNGAVSLLYIWLVSRRRPTTIRLLSKATNNKWSMRYIRFLSSFLPRSKWVSIPYDILFRKTGIVVYSVFWFVWTFYDVWFGLFVPNMGRMKDGSDFEWGFGQVLAVCLLASHALTVYQTWSDDHEKLRHGSREHFKTADRALDIKRKQHSSFQIRKDCVERGICSERSEDGYESGLDPELDRPLFKILLAFNSARERKG